MAFLYPARVTKEGKEFLVTFPDVPEAITSGATQEEALEMAADALVTAMDFYFEDRRAVPMPSAPKRGQVPVELPASVAAKVLLLNELVASGVRNAELARRMGTSAQEVTRLTDLHHPTKIDTVARALNALGRTLELRVA
jgi:antitoxin HicB